MECPGCHGDEISARAKLRVALRSQVRCPACGVQVRLSLWPRVVHSVVGDLSVALGFAASLWTQAPAALVLSIAWWLALSLAMPMQAGGNQDEESS